MAFSKIKNKKVRLEKLELLSIHIPKTAGTSFYNILKDQYGAANVIRVDFGKLRPIRIDQDVDKSPKTAAHARVLHGHFSIEKLKEYFEFDDSVPVITWLRNPVERVASNYFYLSKMLHENIDERKILNVLPKMERSLIEYAQLDLCRNRITRFLEGFDPGDLFFTGLVEQYEKDVRTLARLLNWDIDNLNVYHFNKTSGTARKIDKDDWKKLEELNKLDMAFYKETLKLKEAENEG